MGKYHPDVPDGIEPEITDVERIKARAWRKLMLAMQAEFLGGNR